MENKKFIIPMFLALGVLMMVGLASATTTINTPTSGLAVNGTYVFNVTTDLPEALNCSFATTGDGIFAWTVNASASQTEFTNSTDTSTLTDALATTLTVTCYNDTASESGTQTFDVDNTDPICSFTIDRDFVGRQSGLGITVADASSDTTTLTYAYDLTNEDGTLKQTSTSQNPTFSNGDLEDLGEHTITLTVTDEVSKTASCTQKFLVKSSSGDDDDDTAIGQIIGEAQRERNMWIWIIIGAVLLIMIIAVVVWYYTEQAKKK